MGRRARRKQRTIQRHLKRHDDGGALDLELEPLHVDAPSPEHAWETTKGWVALSSRSLVSLLAISLAAVVLDDVNVRLQRPVLPEGNSTSAMDADRNESFSVLPRKLFSVIGLESSGTRFVTELIQNAVDPSSSYRNGHQPCEPKRHACNEKNEIQVQHWSLPYGSTCSRHPNPPVVDIVLPSQCTRDQEDWREREACDALARDAWNISLHGRPKSYPKRYMLDIVASRRWHATQGVDQVFVIVVRDKTISNIARGLVHCKDPALRKREEQVGTALLLDAVNALILSRAEGKINTTAFERWVPRERPPNRRPGEDGGRGLRALPSGEGAVLVSYESLVKLGDAYVRLLFEALGINSTRRMDVKDSNRKYIDGRLHT